MKANCERFVEDIAAFSSDAARLSPDAAAHLQNCASCREKVAEFQALAAIHRDAAAHLPEPNRRLGRRQLERALINDGTRGGEVKVSWRPVLGGVLVLALIIGIAVTYRTPPEEAAATHQPMHERRDAKATGETFEPTMLALRHGMEGGREQMLVGTTGDRIRPYRLKDVETELKN